MTYIKDSFTILSFKFVLSFAFSSTIFVTFFFSSFNSWENLNKWNKNIKQNIILKISKCKVFKKNGEVYTKLTKLNVHSSYIIQNWQSLYIVFHLYVKRLWQCLYIYNLFTLIWNYNFFYVIMLLVCQYLSENNIWWGWPAFLLYCFKYNHERPILLDTIYTKWW